MINLEPIRVIAFDWDGTLFDSMSVKEKNLATLISSTYGVDARIIARRYRELSGIPRELLFRQLVRECCGRELTEMDYRELSLSFSRLNIAALKKKRVFPDVEESMPLLARDYLLFVSSASAAIELESIVSEQAIRPFMTAAWGSRPGFFKGRDHFKKMREMTSSEWKEILFIGDDVMDEKLARDAGVRFLRILRKEEAYQSYSGPKLRDLSELVSASRSTS